MIQESQGNLLDADADALVNTVNTVGVMGKGIALQFKRAYPGNYKAYKRACDQGAVKLGRMFVWYAGALGGDGPRYIINFPTKNHWRSRSKLSDIRAGLDDLVRQLNELSVTSVAVPPLGCGHGGLRWDEVRPLIEHALDEVPDVTVLLYPPEGAFDRRTGNAEDDFAARLNPSSSACGSLSAGIPMGKPAGVKSTTNIHSP